MIDLSTKWVFSQTHKSLRLWRQLSLQLIPWFPHILFSWLLQQQHWKYDFHYASRCISLALGTFFSSHTFAQRTDWVSALWYKVRRVIHTSLTQISGDWFCRWSAFWRSRAPLKACKIITLRCCGAPTCFWHAARRPFVREWGSRGVQRGRRRADEEQDQKFQKTRARCSTAIAMVENYFGIYLWDHVSYHQFRHTLLLQIMNCASALQHARIICHCQSALRGSRLNTLNGQKPKSLKLIGIFKIARLSNCSSLFSNCK